MSSKLKSSIVIDGTSTLHDWSMTLENFEVTAQIDLSDKKQLKINKLNFQGNSRSLKSDSDSMDKNAYSALKTAKFPGIYFTLLDIESLTSSEITIIGNLKVMGIDKKIKLKGQIQDLNETQINVIGATQIKMSEFGVIPPSFMFGMLTTGDQIKIKYKIFLEKQDINLKEEK